MTAAEVESSMADANERLTKDEKAVAINAAASTPQSDVDGKFKLLSRASLMQVSSICTYECVGA